MFCLKLIAVASVLSAACFAFSLGVADALDPRLFSTSDAQLSGIDSPAAKDVEETLHWRYIDHSGKFVNKIGAQSETTDQQTDDDDFGSNDFKKDIVDQTGTKTIAPNATVVQVYPFSEGLAAFRMRLRLVEQYYPENIPERYRDKSVTGIHFKYDSGTDNFGLCGYIDESGRIVIPPQFEHAYKFHEGLARVEGFQLDGYIDKSGHYLANRKFMTVWPFREGIAVGYKGIYDFLFMDRSGKIIADNFENVAEFSEGIGAGKRQGQWTLFDKTGNVICTLEADTVGMFHEGLALIMKDQKYGFIDRSGKLVIPMDFADAKDFSGGIAKVGVALTEAEGLSLLESTQEWRCGYIDEKGNLKIEPKYYSGRFFSEGLAPVRHGLKWGYVDTGGLLKIEPRFDDALPFSEGLAGVRIGVHWGYIDRTGQFAIPPKFGVPKAEERRGVSVNQFSEGVAIVKKPNYEWAYIDRKGSICLQRRPGDFPSDANNFHEGLALVQIHPGENWIGHAYVNRDDQVVFDRFGGASGPFSEGLAMVLYTKDGKKMPLFGFINKSGKFVIAPIFDNARSIKEGMAAVAQGKWSKGTFDGKWQFIDRHGREVTKSIYDEVSDFSEGLAAVKIGERWGFIDKSGKSIVSPQYEKVGSFSNGLAVIVSNSKYGYINRRGKQVISPQYWLAGPFNDGRALVVFRTTEGLKMPENKQASLPPR